MPEQLLAKLGRSVSDPKWLAGALWRRVTERIDGPWFPYLERVGIHARKVHFYSPIPDTRSLPADLWRTRSSLPGVDLRLDAQIVLAEQMARAYSQEFAAFPLNPTDERQRFYLLNNMYGSVDAEVLYGIIRSTKPRRVVEIGSGFSTLLMSAALERNRAEGSHGEITAIEPFPRDFLPGLPSLAQLIRTPVQQVPLSFFESLDAGDVLFIDSSHVAKVGSDVCYELLEIVPRLRPGVLVHIHDIFFPEEYPRSWIMERHYFWNEQYLLRAFLAFNRAFEVLWAGRAMHVHHPEVLARSFPSYPQHAADNFPSSFWMRRTP